jgi:N-acyl-D-amino-acid deacylase
MRGYRQRAAAGIAEAVEIARGAGIPLHVSHFSGTVDEVVPHLDRAEAAGVDISFDAYPFVASSTILAMAALPTELQTGSPNDTIGRLRSAAGRAALSGHIASPASRDVGAMILAFADAPSMRHLEGMPLAEAARHERLSVADLVVELLVQSEFRVAIIDQRLGAFSEADIREVACDRRHMLGSDGTYIGSHNHVRAYSTFAKFIAITVRSRRLEWHRATQHLSTRAARRFKLVGRGVIQAGAFADVAVLRPESLSYADDVRKPPRHAQGIDHLFVNGVHAVAGGEPTGARGGRALRRDDSGP